MAGPARTATWPLMRQAETFLRRDKMKRKQKVQTIEKTGKFYKGMKLIGLILIAVAIWLAIKGNSDRAFILGIVGVVILIVGKILAWWHHG